jgi:beta-lactamase regulating signal transducer with metallopeptidase domain
VELGNMHEHIARAMYYFEVHLLYASMVCAAAWVLTSIPRGSATTKYWIWVATSFNFILPLGALVDRFWRSRLFWAAPLPMIGDMANTISRGSTAVLLLAVWLVGTTLMFTRLYIRLRADHRDARPAPYQCADHPEPSFLAHGVPVRFVEGQETPAVDGILRPYISLPSGIDQLLSKRELNAVLMHEVTHARRRDNLIRLIYEVGLCALWFHPLIWIAGSRLALYRELSCDESVIVCDRSRDLISALSKLANPQKRILLQATVSSFLGHRLARLASGRPQRWCRTTSALLSLVFGAVLIGGVFGTIAHTACCFVVKR